MHFHTATRFNLDHTSMCIIGLVFLLKSGVWIVISWNYDCWRVSTIYFTYYIIL